MGETEYTLIILVFNVFLLAFMVAIITFVVQYKNKKKENLAKLEQQQILHKQELLFTQMEMQTQTMQQIGREIHDNVGQKLTLASLYTQQLAFENKAPNINDKIEHISEIINQSLSELRYLSKSLTDNHIEDHDIATLLQQEFEKIAALKKYEITVNIEIKDLTLPYETKTVLLRITQEFLQNSIKHANCNQIKAKVAKLDQKLCLQLSDDGKGFDVESRMGKGLGLTNMKKRIELIGGSCTMQSELDKGTQLTIEILL